MQYFTKITTILCIFIAHCFEQGIWGSILFFDSLPKQKFFEYWSIGARIELWAALWQGGGQKDGIRNDGKIFYFLSINLTPSQGWMCCIFLIIQ
jgi:hypothetical protein